MDENNFATIMDYDAWINDRPGEFHKNEEGKLVWYPEEN